MSGLVLLVASSILLGQKTNGILLSCRGLCSQLLQGILDELQKWICRTVCPSLAAYREPLAHHQNLASLSHYFGRCSSELSELLPLPYSRERSPCYSDRCMIILSPLLDVTRMSMSIISFLAQLDSRILCLKNVFI